MEMGIVIDKLEITYLLTHEITDILNEDFIDLNYFELRKSKKDLGYKIVYEIWTDSLVNNEKTKVYFGNLYFGSYKHFKNQLYISLSNRILYTKDDLCNIYYIQDILNLKFICISRLDIAFDVNKNIIKRFLNVYEDIQFTPIILNKKVDDMNEDVKQLLNISSGTRKNPFKNNSIYISNSEGGLIFTLYDKLKEINDKNEKDYIIEDWKSKKKYRCEIRTYGHILKDTLDNINMTFEDLYYRLCDKNILFDIFINLADRIIRFNKKNKKYNVLEILL